MSIRGHQTVSMFARDNIRPEPDASTASSAAGDDKVAAKTFGYVPRALTK